MNLKIKTIPENEYGIVIDISHKYLEPICQWNYDYFLLCAYSKHNILLGAYIQKKLVGFVVVRNHDFFEIEALAVEKKYRRKGIGKALIKAVINKARSMKEHHLVVSSIVKYRATNFYTKMGFEIENESKDPVLGLVRDFVMTI